MQNAWLSAKRTLNMQITSKWKNVKQNRGRILTEKWKRDSEIQICIGGTKRKQIVLINRKHSLQTKIRVLHYHATSVILYESEWRKLQSQVKRKHEATNVVVQKDTENNMHWIREQRQSLEEDENIGHLYVTLEKIIFGKLDADRALKASSAHT